MAMASGLLLLLLAVVAPAVHGVDHTVGGSDGWSQSTDLATWAAGETFNVGDNLLFSYSGMHSLDIVGKDEYEKCTGKALKTFSGGQTTVPLLKAGPMYFICPTSGHCASGMKLTITVDDTTTTKPPATTKSPTTTTPSGDTSPSIISPPSGYSSDGSTTTSSPKTDKSGAEGHFGHFNQVMLGFALVVAGMVSFMG